MDVSLDTGVMAVTMNVTVKTEQPVIRTVVHVMETCVKLGMVESIHAAQVSMGIVFLTQLSCGKYVEKNS